MTEDVLQKNASDHPKVFVKAKLTKSALERLESAAEVFLRPDTDMEELCGSIGNSDAIICHGPERLYTQEFFESASNLKILARTSVGTDMVDLVSAAGHSIVVTNTPGANAISVAELGLLLMLALSRKTVECHERVCNGEPFRRADIYQHLQGVELYQKVAGLVGYGAVGQRLAERALAMGMTVKAFDPYVKIDTMRSNGVVQASLDEILSDSDYLVLCCPLTEENRGLINNKSLSSMKSTAFLINIARGALVESNDLVEALTKSEIAGAALDVTVPEPPLKDDPLLNMENVILSAHQGGNTEECWERMCHTAVDNVLQFFNGERPQNLVNPEVFESMK